MKVVGIIIALVLLVVFIGLLRNLDLPRPRGSTGHLFEPFAPSSSTISAPSTGSGQAGSGTGSGKSVSYRLVRFYAVSTGTRGFVTLKNVSSQSIFLGGWRISSSAGTVLVPPGVRATAGFYGSREEDITLGPGETFTIYAGTRAEYSTSYSQPSEWAGWAGTRFMGEAHDRLTLRDRSGPVVDTYEY